MLTRSRWHLWLGSALIFFAYVYTEHNSFKWRNKNILKVEHWQLWKVNEIMGHLEIKSNQWKIAGGMDGPGSIKNSIVKCHHLTMVPCTQAQNRQVYLPAPTPPQGNASPVILFGMVEMELGRLPYLLELCKSLSMLTRSKKFEESLWSLASRWWE